MKRYLLKSVALTIVFVVVSLVWSSAQVTIQNITYSHSPTPYTVDASGIVPPCGASTGTLTVNMLTSTLPAGTVYTIQAQSSLGYNQINTQTTVTNNQLITQSYSGLAGSPSGVFYSIIIRTPRIPPSFNDSTYLAVINLRVFSTRDFQAAVIPIQPLCPVPPNRGSASVNIISGTAPYTYTWTTTPNPGNSPSAPNLIPGIYSVYVRDAFGCDTTMPFTIIEQRPVVSLSSNPPPPVCNPTFPLSITWTATPVAPWVPNPAGAYSWDNGVTFITSNTQTQTGINTFGNYSRTVIFRDENNCLSDPVTVTVPVDSRPQVTAIANPASVCPGLTSLVTATLIPPCSSIGGTCQFSFNNGGSYAAPNTFTTPPINRDTTIIVRVRNSTGCVSDPFPVNIDTAGRPRIIPTVTPTPICPNDPYSINVNCVTNCTAVEISFNGGGFVAGSPQTFTQPVAPLVASTTSFPVSSRGANGCRFDTTVTVTVFTNTLSITGPNTPVCANNTGSTITLTATGFAPATALTWSTSPAGMPGDGATTTSITVGRPTAGNTVYTLTGTDINNCPRTTTFTLTANPQPTASLTGPPIHCEGTNSTLTASGGTSYEWYNSTFTTQLAPSGSTFGVTPTATTTYGVIVTDANGCRDSATYTLPFQPRPTGTASASPNIICAGNTTNITLTANLPFTPNAAGGYSINNGINYSGTTASPFTFNSVGPFSGTTIINTRFRDDNGCISLTIPVTITVNPFTATITGASALCSYSTNGTATLTVTGGTQNYEYSIDNVAGPYTSFVGTSTTLSGLLAGVTQTVYVRDAPNACNTSAQVTVTTPPVLNIDTISSNDVVCRGDVNGSIPVNVIGGVLNFDYFLNTTASAAVFANTTNRTPIYTGLAAGTYSVIVRDANGCLDTVRNIPINEPATALAAPPTTSVNSCFGSTNGTITVPSAATGGWGNYTYNKTTAPAQSFTVPFTFTGLAPGPYSFTVTDRNGCVVNFSQNVLQNNRISPQVIANQSTCDLGGGFDYSPAVGGTPSYTYSLDNITYGILPADELATGVGATRTLYVRDVLSCQADTTVTVVNIPRSIPNITINPALCPNQNSGSIRIDSMHVKNFPSTFYTFNLLTDTNPRVSQGTGTTTSPSAGFTFNNLLAGDYVLQITDQSCPNFVVDSFRVYTSPTVYTVVSTKAPINTAFAVMTVDEPTGFTTSSIALASDINNSTGTVILYNLTGGTPFSIGANGGYQVSVDNPAGLVTTALRDTTGGNKYISFANLAPGPKTIYIRDQNGCSDTIKLEVPGKFFIPNLVTPNDDDDINKYFEIVSLPDNSELKIYNRWGDRVYASTNYDNKYDFKGLADGVYYYELEFQTGGRFKGWVQVMR